MAKEIIIGDYEYGDNHDMKNCSHSSVPGYLEWNRIIVKNKLYGKRLEVVLREVETK